MSLRACIVLTCTALARSHLFARSSRSLLQVCLPTRAALSCGHCTHSQRWPFPSHPLACSYRGACIRYAWQLVGVAGEAARGTAALEEGGGPAAAPHPSLPPEAVVEAQLAALRWGRHPWGRIVERGTVRKVEKRTWVGKGACCGWSV